MAQKTNRGKAPQHIPQLPKRKKLKPAVKLLAGIILIVILAAVVLLARQHAPAAQVTHVKGVAALVNNEPILTSQIDKLYARVPESYRPVITWSSILNRSIEERLLLQYAAQKGVTASVEEVETVMNNYILNANLTVSQAEAKLAQNNFTLADLRYQFKRDMTIENIVNKTLAPDITVSDGEVQRYYDLANLSQRNLTFNEVKTNLTLLITNNKLQQSFNLLLAQLWAQANVTVVAS